jgi:2'-5' RNA ligase
MLKLKLDGWDKIRNIIKPEDLDSSGFENDPHLTLIYGLKSDSDLSKIKDCIEKVKLVNRKVKLDNVKVFENENDVMHYKINEPKLFSLLKTCHNNLKNNIDSKITFPNYKPHVTIAYLKKGKSKDYIDLIPKLDATIDSYWYSTVYK